MDIAAAFFTADFNEYFMKGKYHKDTIPLYIDGQEHAIKRARRDMERTYCKAGKDALHSGRQADAERAADKCENLGDSYSMGYMDGVYYWVPRGTETKKPRSEIPGFQGSDHLAVECIFELVL